MSRGIYTSDPASWGWIHEVREDGSCATCDRAAALWRSINSGAALSGERGGIGTNLAGNAPSGAHYPAESVFEPDMGARGFAVLLVAGLVIAAFVALWVLGVTVGIPL